MIEFKHVNKKYPNGFEALKDIDLTIGQGEFVAIIGLSGAGKSTLIRTINRMHDITNGTLTVDGTDVMQLHGKSLRAFRRRIGMIFQSFNLVTRTTVIKNVLTAFVPELPWWRAALGIFTKAEKTAALEALDKESKWPTGTCIEMFPDYIWENALEILFGRISQKRTQAVTVVVPTHIRIGDTA